MEEVPGFASQRGRGWTVQHTAACPIDPGRRVPSLWLERQIARCEGVAIIGLHACSRVAENCSSLAPCTMPAPGLFLPACQIHIQTCHGNHAAVTARRRAPMPPEAPVASREAKSHCRVISPAYPVGRRGAFGCLRHMSRILCLAQADLEPASWSSLVRTVYAVRVPARARFLTQQQQQPSAHAQLHVMHYALLRHTPAVMS
jgi:hypothetical protein